MLLVESDPRWGAVVRDALREDAWSVDWVRSATRLRSLLANHPYRGIVLDLRPPAANACEIVRELRARRDTTPVLAIGAGNGVADRIAALDAGADDVLAKPFDAAELPARLRAVRRRRIGSVVGEYRVGDLRVDVARKTVCVGDDPVRLSAQEFKTLVALMQRVDRVVTRRELEEALYGWNAGVGSNAIEVFVHQLRRKLGAGLIRTVRGFGYRIEAAAS